MKKKIVGALAVAAAAVLAVFGFMVWSARSAAAEAVSAYNAAVQEYSEKIGPYNEAAAGIAAENARLQEVLDQAGSVIAQGKEAYEPDTLDMLQEEMKKAEKALADVPARLDPFAEMEMSGSFNRKELEAEKLEAEAAEAAVGEAMEKIPPLPEVPDFTDRIDAVQKAQKVYEDSVRRLANVTAPADAFVRERVRGLETVMQTAAVSEKNDPNGLLGKTGGYLGCVYFLDERIDLNLLPAEVMPEEEGSDDGPAESESAPEEADEGAGSGGSSGESASVAAEEADSAGTGKTAAASAPGERDAAASFRNGFRSRSDNHNYGSRRSLRRNSCHIGDCSGGFRRAFSGRGGTLRCRRGRNRRGRCCGGLRHEGGGGSARQISCLFFRERDGSRRPRRGGDLCDPCIQISGGGPAAGSDRSSPTGFAESGITAADHLCRTAMFC